MFLDIESTSDIHLRNILRIIIFAMERKQTTRKEIARSLDLSAGTVSSICNKLLLWNIAREYKQASQSMGPRVKVFLISEDVYYLGVLDLHRRKTARLYIVQLNTAVLAQYDFAIPPSLPQFFLALEKVYFKTVPEVVRKKIIGMAVPIAATMCEKSRRIVSATVPIFEGVALEGSLKNLLHVPVFVENESVVCVHSSVVRSEKNATRSVYIFIEEGLGIGVMIKNSIISGDNGLGSDVCNIISPYSKTNATVEQVLCEQSQHSMNIKAQTLGYLVGILVNLFDINIFYIGGYLAQHMHHVHDEVEKTLEEVVLHKELRAITLIPDIQYSQTIIHGSAIALIKQHVSSLKSRSQ